MGGHSLRWYAGILTLALGMSLVIILGSIGDSFSNGAVWPPNVSMNLIAVVGTDSQIKTYRPDGTDGRAISEGEGLFSWPTWSPDTRRIVYSGLAQAGTGQGVVTLFYYDTESMQSEIVYASEPGFAGLLADGVLHYPLWSPNGERLAFVVVTPEHGLTLFIADAESGGEPRFALDSGPMWMSWSSDSEKLFVHRAQDHFIVSDFDSPSIRRAELQSDDYRVPAWMPGTLEAVVLQQTSGMSYGLYLASISPTQVEPGAPIVSVGRNAAFLWSDSGGSLAVADDARPLLYGGVPTLVYNRLRVLDASTFGQIAEMTDNLLAYFWSPDGSRIAYVALADASGGLRWSIMDARSGDVEDFAEFTPSRDQLTMFQFFDQYAYSHRLWSPDSRYFTFAGHMKDTASSASVSAQRGVSRVYIVDTGPLRSVIPLSEGLLGVWSPR